VEIYPVNPSTDRILGLRAYQSVGDIEDEIDLASVIAPAESVIDTFGALIGRDVKGVVVITADFKEIGRKGAKREGELSELCRGESGSLSNIGVRGFEPPTT
jgi:acyl-CoA synthetase (NDP forming)